MQNFQAQQEFRKIIEETLDRQGWDMPRTVQDYCAGILCDKLDKNPWDPQPSYAEQYMTVRTVEQARCLGDTCFFARALFPDYMNRRGINSTYFVQLGTGCYSRVLREYDVPAIQQLNDHFEYIAEMIWTAVRSEGNFRSMWQL